MDEPDLPIHDMHERHPGLTTATAASHTEALRICLDRHHCSPTRFELVSNGQTLSTKVRWTPVDGRAQSAWGNRIDTTEAGAYACILAAVELAEGLVAVERADTGTGADYYVAVADEPLDDLESAYRLEVSGLDAGRRSAIRARLERKRRQAAAGESALPAIAGVVGFRERLILLARVDDSVPDRLGG